MIVPEQTVEDIRISSTYIRRQIESGDMATAVRYLGHGHMLTGTVVTGRRALTLRFLPGVHLISAPPTLPDDILLNILADINEESGLRVPLLVLCDAAYAGFVERNRKTLESRFILREGEGILKGESML